MAVYTILFLITAAAGIPMCGLSEKKDGRTLGIYCIVMAVLFTAVSSLRFGVGYDYNLYAGWFYGLNFTDFDELRGDRREIGIFLLLKLVNIFSADYAAAFPLISLLIYPPLMYYIFKNSDNPWISTAAFMGMGLFFNSMNFMKQFIAAVICAFAFQYAAKGSYSRFFLIVLAASAFHRSALFLLPCVLFVLIDWSFMTLGITAALSAAAYAFSEPLVRWVTQYVYSMYDPDSSREMINGISICYAVMFGVLFVAAFLLRNRMTGDKRSINMIIWCCFGAFFFELIGSRYAIVSRMALLFFIPAVCLGIPKIFTALYSLSEKKKKGRGIAVIAAAVILLMGNCLFLMERNYNGVIPYRTIFEREDNA
ncbi:MAG: EpsG family protein [Oscillospiraceae bacterium]|nr:EpsG family protein [Oscillospiraceae bacterium]